MNKNHLFLAGLFSAVNFTIFGETVSLYCEVHSGAAVESTYMDEQIEAERDADGTFRIDEDSYARLADVCDRSNKYSGTILPSIIGTSGYTRIPYGSTTLAVGSKSRKAKYDRVKASFQQIKRDPEKVMVVFFHGTGSNPISDLNHHSYPSYDDEKGGGELLSFLQARMADHGAEEGVDYLALHGVGSGNLQVTNLHTKFMAKDAYVWLGTVAGSGTAENVQNAILHLKGTTNNPALEEKMARQGESIRRVGKLIVVGWSRGSVTAIEFANELYADPELKDLAVHLFVVDPVPGLGNMTGGYWKNIFHLKPNVKSYFAAYAQDERSFGFTPLVPRVSDENYLFSDSRKAMVVAEFPGAHATLVGNIWDQKDPSIGHARKVESFVSLARVVRGLAQAFIVSHGGHLSGIEYYFGRPSRTISDISAPMLQNFEHVQTNMDDFIKLRLESYTGKVQTFSEGRKYHQDWNVFGNYKRLNDKMQLVMPRSTADDIKGFKLKHNFKDGKRRWVNHFHKVLAKSLDTNPGFEVSEFFNPTYYKTYKHLIRD